MVLWIIEEKINGQWTPDVYDDYFCHKTKKEAKEYINSWLPEVDKTKFRITKYVKSN